MQVETNADLPPPPTTPEEVAAVEQKWLDEVYKGDSLPELTLQVVIVSVFLGALMMLSIQSHNFLTLLRLCLRLLLVLLSFC